MAKQQEYWCKDGQHLATHRMGYCDLPWVPLVPPQVALPVTKVGSRPQVSTVVESSVTKVMGRPRVYGNHAERQRAYRERKRDERQTRVDPE